MKVNPYTDPSQGCYKIHSLKGNSFGNLEKRWILQNTSDKKKNPKGNGRTVSLTKDISVATLGNQKARNNTFKVLKIKQLQNRILYQVKSLFINERKIKTF